MCMNRGKMIMYMNKGKIGEMCMDRGKMRMYMNKGMTG